MPLDSACNPTVKQVYPAHTNACEYARIGLAIWRSDRNAFPRFESWIFAPESAPPLADAARMAEQLVGHESFERARRDTWIGDCIKQSTAIYQQNLLNLGSESMPQLIIGTNVTFGAYRHIDRLYELLADQLGLKRKP
jgi:hypothetical protein